MNHPSDLETLIRSSAPQSQRDRLQRAHDLLTQAGPLPHLPASLLEPPQVGVRPLRLARTPVRRKRHLAAAATAAVALAAASAAFMFTGSSTQTALGVVAMHATSAAPGASAHLIVGAHDRAGNSPVTLHVHGLPALPTGSVYEMYLTDKGHLVGGCGVFRTDGDTTVVHFTVPYRLGEYSGWMITRHTPHQPLTVPLLTTS